MSDTSAKLASDIAEIEEAVSILCKQVPIDQERIDWFTRKLVKLRTEAAQQNRS